MFTPAPWNIQIDWEDRHPIAIIDPTTEDHPQGPLHICNINPNLGKESEANARLIAAAPELLEALKMIEGMCNMPEVKNAMMKHEQAYYWKTMTTARAAIAKAEG